jgi:aldehyde dehydrogenase (NAD+)
LCRRVTEKQAIDEVQLSIDRLFFYAAYADKYGGRVQETPFFGLCAQINEPVGAIGIACPDEAPLLGVRVAGGAGARSAATPSS